MKEGKRKLRNDLLLLAGMLIAGVVLFFAFGAIKDDGALVQVIFDGHAAESFPLGENREVMLDFNGQNLLVIRDGYAFVTYADCPDKLCVKQRKINKDGETIICLPHKLIIKISGGRDQYQ